MSNDEEMTAQDANRETEEQETSILEALYKKGPALPIEVAVRTYSFPEDIATPLANLEQKGLVERQQMKTGEMLVLTKKGYKQVTGM